MYGYIVPDKSRLRPEDFSVYKAYYCGLCKVIAREYGQLPRVAVSYDLTFFSALVFDLLREQPEVKAEACILNPFKKKPVIADNPTFERIAAFCILFAYHNLEDDVKDSKGRKKRLARRLFRKAYLKARAKLPEVDGIITSCLERLYGAERANCAEIDRVSDAFGSLLMLSAREFLGDKSSATAESFFYNLGKWVYLIDALDDIDEDFKSGGYNPFLAALGGYKDRVSFFEENSGTAAFLINITANRIIEDFNGLTFVQCYDLLQNIVYYGIRERTAAVLKSPQKLKPIRV